MNKYSVITIIAILIIISPFVYSGINIVGAEQLQYKWNDSEEFSFFTMMNNGNIELCNPMPFSISFEELQIGSFYNAKNIGCLLYTSPSPRDLSTSRMPSSA